MALKIEIMGVDIELSPRTYSILSNTLHCVDGLSDMLSGRTEQEKCEILINLIETRGQ